jgi:lysine 2,3-aminomutase
MQQKMETALKPVTVDTIDSIDEETQAILRDAVARDFRVAMTGYVKGLMEKSEAIRKQFAPHFAEGIDFGRLEPFEEGKMNRGIYGLERIYEDRAVLTPYFGCASYCRYCFKKARTLAGPNTRMTQQNMDDAIAYIASDSRITTGLITGGDPLAKPEVTIDLVRRLSEIPHVTKIRVGTRHVLFRPEAITDEIATALAAFNRIDPVNPLNSRSVSLGISINHPDELQPEVVEAIGKFLKAGMAVRGQIALLKGINDDAPTIKRLLDMFLAIGMTPYYLFHCMDVVGTYHMRTSVQKGLDILAELAEFSGTYAVPYVYVTPVGKHRVHPGMKLNYEEIDGKRYIKTRSPYKAARFKEFSGKSVLPALHEEDADGYIVSRYLDGNDERIDY